MDGLVSEFDPEVGIGWVKGLRAGRWMFHCTSIEGGSRQIEVGQRVSFRVGPGGLGGWEARSVSPDPS